MSKLSVLMPVYNGKKFLNIAIESVLSQTFRDFEFLIVDDGSTDSSLNIIEGYAIKDHRIKIISQLNKGFGESLNIGLKNCSCEIVARLDQDDVMLPNRIEQQYSFLKKHKEIAIISCLANYINDDGKIIGKTFSDLISVEDCQRYYKKNEAIGILHPGVMLRKSPVMQIGGFRSKFWPAEDIDLWNRMLEEGHKIIVMQLILMQYRVSSSSEIATNFMNSRMKFEWVRKCMLERRAGKKELTWDEFVQYKDSFSFLCQMNRKRKNFAKYYYRKAGYCIGEKKYFLFMINFSLAALLQPMYTFKKIIKQRV